MTRLNLSEASKHSLRAFLKTSLILPVLILLSLIAGIAQCFAGVLLPSALISLGFAVLAGVSPIAFLVSASTIMAIGITHLIYTYHKYTLEHSAQHELQPEFVDQALLGLTLVSMGVMALCIPLKLFFNIVDIIRLTVSLMFSSYFLANACHETFKYYKKESTDCSAKQELTKVFEDLLEPGYQSKQDDFISSYESALERLPDAIQLRISHENDELEYQGAIYHRLMFEPVKMQQSQSKKPYEKSNLMRWLSQYSNIDPISKETITKPKFVTQNTLADKIRTHRKALIDFTQGRSATELAALNETDVVGALYPRANT